MPSSHYQELYDTGRIFLEMQRLEDDDIRQFVIDTFKDKKTSEAFRDMHDGLERFWKDQHRINIFLETLADQWRDLDDFSHYQYPARLAWIAGNIKLNSLVKAELREKIESRAATQILVDHPQLPSSQVSTIFLFRRAADSEVTLYWGNEPEDFSKINIHNENRAKWTAFSACAKSLLDKADENGGWKTAPLRENIQRLNALILAAQT